MLTAPSISSLDDLIERGDIRIVVLRRGCSYRQRLEEVLVRRGIPAPRVLEFGTLEGVFACVAAGLGVTLLPRSLIGPVWRQGKVVLHALEPRDALVETLFVRRRDGPLSSALVAFLSTVRTSRTATVSPVAAE